MARGGRPVERPAHLSPQQRQQAQQQTIRWRQQCQLSQRQMAEAIGVSYSAYRTWENGKDDHAGPTRLQTDQLNKALRRLMHNRYADGDAFGVWGWPREQDLNYGQVVEMLRLASFEVPRLQSNASPPVQVFWTHRVREPNLVHGVFSLAAAAATRAGLPVHLLLDDIGLSDREHDELCIKLESQVKEWVTFASGDETKLSTRLFSSVLTEEYLNMRGWSAVNDYLNGQSNVLAVLLASKMVPPLEYSRHVAESVDALARSVESLSADKLLTPLRNWLVFENEITRILEPHAASDSDSIITLGGEDEEVLWDVWHRGCPGHLARRVQHIYLRPIPMPRYVAPWKERALTIATTNRSLLKDYLVSRTESDDHAELVEWLVRTAIRLPASLNPVFREGLDPILSEIATPLRATADKRILGAVAKAVAEWLST
jgi:hypothetical protein